MGQHKMVKQSVKNHLTHRARRVSRSFRPHAVPDATFSAPAADTSGASNCRNPALRRPGCSSWYQSPPRPLWDHRPRRPQQLFRPNVADPVAAAVHCVGAVGLG